MYNKYIICDIYIYIYHIKYIHICNIYIYVYMSIRQNYLNTKVTRADMNFAYLYETFTTDRGRPSTDTSRWGAYF